MLVSNSNSNSKSDVTTAVQMTGDLPFLYDTSILQPHGSPPSIAGMVPSTTSIHYSYAPSTTTPSKPTVKYGWPISAHPSSTHATHSPTWSPRSTTTEALIRTSASAAPKAEEERSTMSPLFIAIVVLGVVIAVVVVVLVWLTWLRRRRHGTGKGEEVVVEEEGEKSVVREPELSWTTGPTLINQGKRDSHWSAGTLVALNEESRPRGHGGQRVARGRSPAAPPIPPRAVSRRPVPVPGRDRELPSTPAPFTPLMTPVSPVSPERRRPEVIDEDEILPVVDHESYRPSPVSPLESDSFTRSRSVR